MMEGRGVGSRDAGRVERWRRRMGPGSGSGGARTGWRRALPVVFLALSLVVAGVGALEAYLAERSHRETATGVLTDYAEFAAWSYQQKATELLATSLSSSFSIVRGNRSFSLGRATEQCLELLLEKRGGAACDCVPSLAGERSFFTRLDEPSVEAQWVGASHDPGEARALVDAIHDHARVHYREGWSYALAPTTPDGPLVAYTRLVTAGFEPTLESRVDTLVYGFEVDPAALATLYERALRQEPLLPYALTQGRPNEELVRVEALAADGTSHFASHDAPAERFVADARMRTPWGGGTVRASVLPEAADALIIGGLPENRTPLFLLIFILASVLAGAALLQLRRENQLARLRQDFVASVSHELRTPLAQVRLFTETLRLGRTRNDGERDWALENIDRETLRLSHLVENILHFSRAERGVRSAERESTDLGDELRDALEAFRPLVSEARTRFELVAPEPLPASVHRDSFRQVVLNFLDNAVRYGAHGQTVRVVAERAGEAARIAVEDQGPGVPEEDRERIFEAFRRGEGSVGSAVAGSGIGLSVVREIARAHGGRAWVEDAPGGGARFVLELPADHTARPDHFGGTRRERERDGTEREVASAPGVA